MIRIWFSLETILNFHTCHKNQHHLNTFKPKTETTKFEKHPLWITWTLFLNLATLWSDRFLWEKETRKRVCTARTYCESGRYICLPDSQVHGANMELIWGRQDPGVPRVGPMIFAICYLSSSIPYEARLNIRISSYQYRNSHYKDKAISRPSYLYNWNNHIWKYRLYIKTGPPNSSDSASHCYPIGHCLKLTITKQQGTNST